MQNDDILIFPEIRIVNYSIRGGGKYAVLDQIENKGNNIQVSEIDRIELNIPSRYVNSNCKFKVMIKGNAIELELIDAINDLLDHEILHMLLYHIGELEACKNLDAIQGIRLLKY